MPTAEYMFQYRMSKGYPHDRRVGFPMVCQDCGAAFLRQNANQVRCNPCRILAERAWRAETRRQWKANDPEAYKAETKRYLTKAKADGRKADQDRRWKQANPEKVKAKKLRHQGRIKAQQIDDIPQNALVLLVQQQGGRCIGCSRKFGTSLPPTRDHIIPLSEGGVHSMANLQAMCASCNSSKGAKSEADWRREKLGQLL